MKPNTKLADMLEKAAETGSLEFSDDVPFSLWMKFMKKHSPNFKLDFKSDSKETKEAIATELRRVAKIARGE